MKKEEVLFCVLTFFFFHFFFFFLRKKEDVSQETFLLLNTFPDGLSDSLPKGSMSGRSIFSFDDPELSATQDLIRSGNLSAKEQRGLGILFGMVCGDAIGAPLEFSSVRYNVQDFTEEAAISIPEQLWKVQSYNRFRLKPGQWTDDASMGLCLMDSLLVHRAVFNPQDLRLRFHNWLEREIDR